MTVLPEDPMILFSFIFIERKQEFWAALMIVLGTMTKIYGIVGLAFLLFSKRRIAFLKGLIFWGIVLYVLPMLYTSPQYVASQYVKWYEVLLDKNVENLFTPYTNISLLGMVRKISGVNTYSDLWLVIPGLLLFIGGSACIFFALLFCSWSFLAPEQRIADIWEP